MRGGSVSWVATIGSSARFVGIKSDLVAAEGAVWVTTSTSTST